MPPLQLNLTTSTFNKHRPKITYFLRFGTAGTIAHTMIYTARQPPGATDRNADAAAYVRAYFRSCVGAASNAADTLKDN